VRAKPWKPWDPKEPPSFLLTASKSHDDKGDVYLEPEEYASQSYDTLLMLTVVLTLSSFIVKVKAAEITKSGEHLADYRLAGLPYDHSFFTDQYHMKYTMRFPRALSIRDDLTVSDCLTASGSYCLLYQSGLVISLKGRYHGNHNYKKEEKDGERCSVSNLLHLVVEFTHSSM